MIKLGQWVTNAEMLALHAEGVPLDEFTQVREVNGRVEYWYEAGGEVGAKVVEYEPELVEYYEQKLAEAPGGAEPTIQPEPALPTAGQILATPLAMAAVPPVLTAAAKGAVTGAAIGAAREFLGNGGAIMTMGYEGNGVLPFIPRGPGVPEPPQAMVAKHWRIMVRANDIGNYWVYFWRLIDGRFTSYNPRSGLWKVWRAPKHIVLPGGRKGPTLHQAVRAQKKLDQLWRVVVRRTALTFEKGRRPKTT